MITRFITEVHTRFNPFDARARILRVFIAQFGPSTFAKIKFHNQTLPRSSAESSELKVKFSDGKQIELNPAQLNLTEIYDELDRHSRTLIRKEKLAS